MITGERVTLRPFRVEDIPTLRRWHDDGEVMQYWGQSQPVVAEHEFEADLAPGGRFTKFGESAYFCICDETGRPIGRIDYEGLRPPSLSCELGIFIGEPDAWSKGYGSEAIVLLLDWAFNQRGAHRVWLTTQSTNERAKRAYEKVGFVRLGVWRECYFYDGGWHDEDVYDLLDREFNARYRPDGVATRPLRRPS
jgi:RimJ/RimL family protein N-acetyltransferase